MSGQRPHVVYLLRLWQACTEHGPVWRAWLSSPYTGERSGFATLDELFIYLQARVQLLEFESGSGRESVADLGLSEEPD